MQSIFRKIFIQKPMLWLQRVILRFMERKDYFVTYHKRPRHAAAVQFDPVDGFIDTGIILQGPVLNDYEFTLQTIQLYRKLYPDVKIIVSTWSDTEEHFMEEASRNSVEVVLNAKPHVAGIANVNYQIISTRAGVKRAVSMGLKNVLKTRTDQRFYSQETLPLLHNLTDLYKPFHSALQKRLIAVSMNSFRFRPYSISDMFLFGNIDDQKKFWSLELDSREGLPEFPSLRTWSEAEMAEVFLVANFIRLVGWQPDFSLKDSWRVIRDFFCIIDAAMIDLYWPKYSRHLEHRYNIYQNRTDAQMTHAFWLNLLQNEEILSRAPDKVLSLPFAQNIPGLNSITSL